MCVLLINKPSGPTSHDMIYRVRRATGIKKVGHAGTLDPFAEGLLIILVGRDATKRQSGFMGLDKEYEATIRLGIETDTYDREGKVIDEYWGGWPTEEKIKKALEGFVGEQMQMPPAFSAKKIKGKKAYDLARKGEEVILQPVRVVIHSLEVISYDSPMLKIRTRVSSGTYIRSLAHDIGASLGTGAHLTELRRTSIGGYSLKDTIDTKGLTRENWKKHCK